MTENNLAESFESIREFFTPRIEKHTTILSLSLEDIKNERVKQFFAQHQFCQDWLNGLSVAGWARLAFNCECHTLQEMEEVYLDTEFGAALFDNELFCFAITADGGFWVVSMRDGHIDRIDGTASDEKTLFVEEIWPSFQSFINEIEATNLRDE